MPTIEVGTFEKIGIIRKYDPDQARDEQGRFASGLDKVKDSVDRFYAAGNTTEHYSPGKIDRDAYNELKSQFEAYRTRSDAIGLRPNSKGKLTGRSDMTPSERLEYNRYGVTAASWELYTKGGYGLVVAKDPDGKVLGAAAYQPRGSNTVYEQTAGSIQPGIGPALDQRLAEETGGKRIVLEPEFGSEPYHLSIGRSSSGREYSPGRFTEMQWTTDQSHQVAQLHSSTKSSFAKIGVIKYDSDQPRNEHGEFASNDGSRAGDDQGRFASSGGNAPILTGSAAEDLVSRIGFVVIGDPYSALANAVSKCDSNPVELYKGASVGGFTLAENGKSISFDAPASVTSDINVAARFAGVNGDPVMFVIPTGTTPSMNIAATLASSNLTGSGVSSLGTSSPHEVATSQKEWLIGSGTYSITSTVIDAGGMTTYTLRAPNIAKIDVAKGYNPDQPRDDHGRFADASGMNSATKDDEYLGNRLGRCYELAAKYILHNNDMGKHQGDLLVHGSIQGGGNPRIAHAWVLTNNGYGAWEPATNKEWPISTFNQYFKAQPVKEYTYTEAAENMVSSSNYGPWGKIGEDFYDDSALRKTIKIILGLEILKYSDDEERDNHGRWTSGSGGTVDLRPRVTAGGHDAQARGHAQRAKELQSTDRKGFVAHLQAAEDHKRAANAIRDNKPNAEDVVREANESSIRAYLIESGKRVRKFDESEMRDSSGRWASDQADDVTYAHATSGEHPGHWSRQVVKQLSNGEHPYVTSKEVGVLLKQVTKSGDPRAATADIMSLRINGTRLMGQDGLGYKRSEMPQIDGKSRAQFFEDMQARGITVTPDMIDPLKLQPSQSEIGVSRVAEIFKQTGGKISGKQILVSQDNYVIDGHHHWAADVAAALTSKELEEMPIIRLGANGEDLVKISKQWADDHGLQSRALGKIVIGRLKKTFNPDEPRGEGGRWVDSATNASNMIGYAQNVAQRLVSEGTRNAQKITNDVVNAIHAGEGQRGRSTFNGKDTTVKSAGRLVEKLVEPLNETKTVNRARIAQEAYNMGDVVRYTGLYSDDKIGGGVKTTIDALQNAGYEPLKMKNFFNDDTNNGYRGINSVWEDKATGQRFELQFHTPASFDEQSKWHGVYESIRTLPMSSEEYKSTRVAMLAGFSSVPIPPGVEDIGTRSVKKKKDVI